jgi:hypothetical protein
VNQQLPPCLRCQSVIEADDLRCPVCYLAINRVSSASTAVIRVQTLRCRSCGAALEYRASLQAPQCAFCGGVLALEEKADPVEQTERHLPFAFGRQAATDTYRRWLQQLGWFRPSNLASASRLESLHALWWVGWVVNADALITWTADSDAGAQRAKWAPHSGEIRTAFNGLVIPASRGLTVAECTGLIPSYSLGNTRGDTQPDDPEAVLERFELPRSAARSTVLERIRRQAESEVQARQIPGHRFRNLHIATQLRGLASRRVAFPAYVIAYRYRGRLYRTVISGQDAGCIIGNAPHSVAKVILVIVLALMTLGGLAIGLLLLLK